MDRFVRNFIAMSIFYLVLAAALGVAMIASPGLLTLRFVHSHLMLLGWVSMMIYGVGYHILPRFAGRMIKNTALCELQFWLANIGLVGLVVFYTVMAYGSKAGLYKTLAALFGAVEAVSIVLFFYTMVVTVFAKEEPAQ